MPPLPRSVAILRSPLTDRAIGKTNAPMAPAVPALERTTPASKALVCRNPPWSRQTPRPVTATRMVSYAVAATGAIPTAPANTPIRLVPPTECGSKNAGTSTATTASAFGPTSWTMTMAGRHANAIQTTRRVAQASNARGFPPAIGPQPAPPPHQHRPGRALKTNVPPEVVRRPRSRRRRRPAVAAIPKTTRAAAAPAAAPPTAAPAAPTPGANATATAAGAIAGVARRPTTIATAAAIASTTARKVRGAPPPA